MGLVVLPDGSPATPDVPSLAVAPTFKEGTSAVDNFHSIRFESESEAQKWIDQCRVRWVWYLGMVNASPYAETPNWVAQARRGAGQIHDTKHHLYSQESGEVRAYHYLRPVKVQDGCYAIIGKL
jgi:hypothetical protein